MHQRRAVEQEFSLWVGIDWATEEHQVCGVDRRGKKLFESKVRHEGEDIARFVEDLLSKVEGRAEQVAVAIETPRGSIVEALMDRGVAAYSINPKQLDRFRDRYTVGGAKSDKLDAFVMGDTLRTDFKLYRRIELGDPVLVQMRELSRAHEALSQDARSLGSRLREQLVRYYPQVLALGSVYDEAWLWDLLELAPTPAEAARLSHGKVASILRQRRVRRVKAEAVTEKLRERALVVAPGVVQAASAHVRLLLPLLRLANQQISDCDRRIAELMEQLRSAAQSQAPAEGDEPPAPRRQHRDADILLSLPGLGVLTGATMLSEGATALRDRDYQALRSQTGVAPVSSQTGKQRRPTVSMRRACNLRLRNATYHWARVSMQHDAVSRAHYKSLRAAGHAHGRALRGVADRLLAMLVAMLRSGSLYDPSRRLVPKAA
jgi:transposase